MRLFHDAPHDTLVYSVDTSQIVDVLKYESFQLRLTGSGSNKFKLTADNLIRVKEYPLLRADIDDTFDVILTAYTLDQSEHSVLGSVELEIIISERNIYPPTFEALADLEVHRLSAEGAYLGTLRVRDRDTVEYNQASVFRLVSADRSIPITVDPQTGILKLSRAIVHDKVSAYRFTALATNKGSPPLYDSKALQLHVRGVSGEE